MEISLSLILWIVGGAAFLLAFMLGAILSYHWIRFAMNPILTSAVIGIYATISTMLLITIFTAVAAFSS